VHASALTVFVAAVSLSYHLPGGDAVSSLFVTNVSATQQDSSVDDATALQIAGNMALHADLPIAANITNRSTSLQMESIVNRNNAAMISKPLGLMPTTDDRSIISYIVKDGDTVQSVADQYKITPQTVKWANNLTADSLEIGSTLTLPPIDGILYTIKDGDTIESIAAKYKSDAALVTTFNDLELSGIKNDQRIILPNGELPVEEQPGYVAPVVVAPTGTSVSASGTSSLVNGYSPVVATASGNAYAFGNCTSWAYERRAQLGHPVGSYWGNGATWDSSARASGYVVDKNPTVGAVYQMPAFVDAYTGAYGHVGIVEAVNPDGSIYISEMNYAGNFNVVTYRTIPATQVALYNYIH
jgi:N-acetylmuramoyl-L-alanine amidase